MEEKTTDLYQKAKDNVLAMIRPNVKPEDALKFSQAALNLSHASKLDEGKATRTRGAGS